MGYPSPAHKAKILADGKTPWHRVSYTVRPPKAKPAS